MQWAYYWYYSALGCHGHLVRDIQFSLFHHHYLWGHLLWKMNSASFAWLISNFFFIYLTEGHMPGIWSSWKKKKWKKKKSLGEDEWSWSALGAGCGGKADLLGPLASPAACVIPARATFFPLSYCTQNRARKLLPAVFLEASWFLTHCWWVYFNFLIPWTVGYEINAAEDKSNLPCLSVLCVVLLGLPLVGERVFSFFLCVLSQHSYQNWTCRHLWAVWSWCEVRDAR